MGRGWLIFPICAVASQSKALDPLGVCLDSPPAICPDVLIGVAEFLIYRQVDGVADDAGTVRVLLVGTRICVAVPALPSDRASLGELAHGSDPSAGSAQDPRLVGQLSMLVFIVWSLLPGVNQPLLVALYAI